MRTDGLCFGLVEVDEWSQRVAISNDDSYPGKQSEASSRGSRRVNDATERKHQKGCGFQPLGGRIDLEGVVLERREGQPVGLSWSSSRLTSSMLSPRGRTPAKNAHLPVAVIGDHEIVEPVRSGNRDRSNGIEAPEEKIRVVAAPVNKPVIKVTLPVPRSGVATIIRAWAWAERTGEDGAGTIGQRDDEPD